MKFRACLRFRRMLRRICSRIWTIFILIVFIWTISMKSTQRAPMDRNIMIPVQTSGPTLKPETTAAIGVTSHFQTTATNVTKKVSRNSENIKNLSNLTKPEKFVCTEKDKRNHYMTIEFRPGRTGNALFQVFCLLSLSSKYCYTAIVEYRNRFFRKLILPVFDIDNIKRVKQIDTSSFHDLSTVISKQVKDDLQTTRQNWTLNDRCVGYAYSLGQEEYIKSSVMFKDEIQKAVNLFLNTNFRKRSTVAIHVRRTDKLTKEPGYDFSDLAWYKPFIDKAMLKLKANYSDLAFIFVSDDLPWCKDNFNGTDIYFSPCEDAGCDLALVASCDHVIITIGTYGWMGAWLGEHKTVIYSAKYVPVRFYRKQFFLPSWIGMED